MAKKIKLNYDIRSKMLEEGVMMWSDDELDRKHTDTLDKIIDYYGDVLEALGGPEIWAILDKFNKAKSVIEDRRKKARNKRIRNYRRKVA